MKNRRLLLFCLCLGMLTSLAPSQEKGGRVEIVRPQDLKRTAYRLRISVERLTNARTALREATDLAVRLDPPVLNDYGSLARLWIQLDRKKAREMIGSMIAQLSRNAQAAEDLESYRKCTNQAQQLLSSLSEVDPEKAMQIVELWPAPSARLGKAGEQALTQFQNDCNNRLMSQAAYTAPEQLYNQLSQPQKAGSIPFTTRSQVAMALMNQNQKDKARAVLDQAIEDMGKRPPEPGKNYDYEGFLRELARMYPERFLDAFNTYQGMVARQETNSNSGVMVQWGEQRLPLSATESAALNIIRSLSFRPELCLKLLNSVPSLRDKIEQAGGIDNVISPSSLTVSSSAPYYPAGRSNPPPAAAGGRDGSPAPESLPNPSQLFLSLRGKAELNPDLVRRKLSDTYRQKEHFSHLISIAQMANYQDPDFSAIALDLAREMLPLFDNLQQRANSLRTLVSAYRQLEGEVPSSLLKEGLILANEMSEEENNRGQSAPPGVKVPRPSDDLKIMLTAQGSLEDFNAALRSARALGEDLLRIKALMQIAQTLLSNY
jgi:hypothetical protein